MDTVLDITFSIAGGCQNRKGEMWRPWVDSVDKVDGMDDVDAMAGAG